jgi:hypothetical protein
VLAAMLSTTAIPKASQLEGSTKKFAVAENSLNFSSDTQPINALSTLCTLRDVYGYLR